MTTDYHTPIAVGAPVNSAIVNAPLAELDEKLGDLIEGSVTGATAQAQAFTVGVSLADTTTSTSGVIFKASDRFIHNFHHPTGNTATPVGLNTFFGVDAGNFTMGSTASETYHGSYNIGIGYNTLTAVTTGSRNTAIGVSALYSNANGVNNAAVGANALENNTGGAFNVAVGSNALYNNTTGLYNTAIGTNAGRYQDNGYTALETAKYGIYIGHNACGKDNDDVNSIVIGTSAIGLGANTTAIGNSETTVTELPGGSLRINEMSAPTGEANKATIYAVDNGAGKTQLMVIFGSGAAQQLAIEP